MEQGVEQEVRAFGKETLPVWEASGKAGVNSYVEFVQEFEVEEEGAVSLRLGCDSRAAVYVNETLVGLALFDGTQTICTYETFDLGAPGEDVLVKGTNVLRVVVYYQGKVSNHYTPRRPELIFQVEQSKSNIATEDVSGKADDHAHGSSMADSIAVQGSSTAANILACSGPHTRSRILESYQQGAAPTNQMGFNWSYDAGKALPDFAPVKVYEADSAGHYRAREIKRQVLMDRAPAKLIAQGLFRPDESGRMERDFLSSRNYEEIFAKTQLRTTRLDEKICSSMKTAAEKLEQASGQKQEKEPLYDRTTRISEPYYLLFDLGEESTGLLDLEFTAPAGTLLKISWGEHLEALRTRSHIGNRTFQSTYVCKEGYQHFIHYFNRLGLRYLELHVYPAEERMDASGDIPTAEAQKQAKTAEIIWHYAGIRPLMYPVAELGGFSCKDALHQKIYDTAVRTLWLCMHEHYEDCPWREQALYSMDSLNQTLCGYYCFGEWEFARGSLRILGESMEEDGFLQIAPPGSMDITIPYFSFQWVLALRDYLYFTKDRQFVEEMWPYVERLIHKRLETLEDGLLPVPLGEKYWHFYEWSDGLDGLVEQGCKGLPADAPKRVDAPFQLTFLLMLQAVCDMAGLLQKEELQQQLKETIGQMQSATHTLFFSKERDAYLTYADERDGQWYLREEAPKELVQAWALLAGIVPGEKEAPLLETLAKNRYQGATLSMLRFKYEALLTRPEQYAEVVFDDIAARWGKMLYQGATSFWETEEGASDFGHAGSLCHGWSAMPVYFYYAYGAGIHLTKEGMKRFPVTYRTGLYEVHTKRD